MSDVEEWAEIPGFELYLISSWGNVRRIERPHNRKQYLNNYGFPCIVLFRDPVKTRYVRQVNKLVCEAFCTPPEYSDQTAVWHIDGKLLNCRADNLKWERRDRVLEWNEMHRTQEPKYKTPKVQINSTGEIFASAFDAAMAIGEIESAVIGHIERYPEDYYDRARYRYV